MKSKKTNPQLNQAQIDASKPKIESEVKTHSKVIKKINHNNFHRIIFIIKKFEFIAITFII